MKGSHISDDEIEDTVRRFRTRFPNIPIGLIQDLTLARLRTKHPESADEELTSRHELLALVGIARQIQGDDCHDEVEA